jgi:hypothetical protein
MPIAYKHHSNKRFVVSDKHNIFIRCWKMRLFCHVDPKKIQTIINNGLDLFWFDRVAETQGDMMCFKKNLTNHAPTSITSKHHPKFPRVSSVNSWTFAFVACLFALLFFPVLNQQVVVIRIFLEVR